MHFAQCHMEILPSLDVEDVEAALRSCLLKLQFADACLKPARKGAFLLSGLVVSARQTLCSRSVKP